MFGLIVVSIAGFLVSNIVCSVIGIILGALGVYYGLVQDTTGKLVVYRSGIMSAVGLGCCLVPYLKLVGTIFAIVGGSLVLRNKS